MTIMKESITSTRNAAILRIDEAGDDAGVTLLRDDSEDYSQGNIADIELPPNPENTTDALTNPVHAAFRKL